MIRAVRYEPGSDAPADIDAGQLRDALQPGSALLWVDVADPSDAELESIAQQLQLSRVAVEDLHQGEQRTKLEHYRDHFHVAVHDCSLRDTGLVTREVDVVFGEGWLVSVRQASNREDDPAPFGLEPVERLFDAERGPDETIDEGFLLWAILDVIVDRYLDVNDMFDDRIDEAEEIVFSGEARTSIPKEIFELRRAMVDFRRAVAPLRDVVSELLHHEADCLGETALVRMRDVLDHVLRVAEFVDSQRDLLNGLLEADLSLASNRMNEVMKRMTSWGAILLGSTLIAGIYGMNFDEMPELRWAFGYPAAIGSMILLTVFLYVYFKRKDYL